MKKTVKQTVSIAIVLLAIQTLQSQNIERYYVEMPNILNPVTTRQQRAELLEYFNTGMGDSIENRFGMQTRILMLDTLNNHILIQNTDISTFEMKIIIAQTDTFIGIIKTVCTPICLSTIDFYSLQWKKRDDITFNFPKSVDWINEEKLSASALNTENVRNALNTSFISLSFNSETSQINATNNSLEFLDRERKKQLTPLMNDAIFVYFYQDGSWVKRLID